MPLSARAEIARHIARLREMKRSGLLSDAGLTWINGEIAGAEAELQSH
ncbi:hypothetical protein [Paenibacillus pasadenensis]|nr:hypothetical protein [Paenibacillus pasadenensis]